MNDIFNMKRRQFLKLGGVAGAGLVLGTPSLWAEEKQKIEKPPRIKTNIDDALRVPKTKYSLPGPFPGKVVQVQNAKAMVEDKPVPEVVQQMFKKGIEQLTGKTLEESFSLFFEKDDVVGIKVNPVGAGLISTRLEVVDVIIDWLTANGIKRENIVIWDRFDYMLTDAGFTPERFPGTGIEGLQMMDEAAASGESDDDSHWLDESGNHVSAENFDKNVYYWADVEGPKDKAYLNQHVFNGKYSYFGNLLTKKLTKIINVPVLKNTGNGISVATKNVGYGAICNTNRLHKPLFFDVCTEVLAFPVIRDKMVLTITDALRAQYDGGPIGAAKFAYVFNTLFFATDPFASDMVCQQLMVEKRKSMKVKVNEHPVYTDYLRYAQRLELGVVAPETMEHIRI
ncbi:MAG: hypothetical protein AMJ46_03755 [Latescibacteria bacterium DG_63]|nr:MAG: hypothetical protein AMJ46_03755 [Latescibacteria bacterium DG_63]